jgi:hypothetical protein
MVFLLSLVGLVEVLFLPKLIIIFNQLRVPFFVVIDPLRVLVLLE